MLHAIGHADIVTDLPVDLPVNALLNYGLYGHILEDVLQWDVKGYHVLVVLHYLSAPVQQDILLQQQFLVESHRLDVVQQDGDQLQVYLSLFLRVFSISFSALIFFMALLLSLRSRILPAYY